MNGIHILRLDLVYGENETHKLYIKMYLAETPSFDIVIVISFHEEGMYD